LSINTLNYTAVWDRWALFNQ